MRYKENIRLLNRFVDKLQDVESERLFDARFSYFVDRDKDSFYRRLDEVFSIREQEFNCGWLDQYYGRYPENRETGIIVFGAGEMGKLTCRSLLFKKKKVDCICDNNDKLSGLNFNGIPILSFSKVCENFKDHIVFVAVSPNYQIEIYHQLLSAGFRESDIVMSNYGGGGLYCDISDQYFDLPAIAPDKDGEYFVDAGCFDAGTSRQCSGWCGGGISK